MSNQKIEALIQDMIDAQEKLSKPSLIFGTVCKTTSWLDYPGEELVYSSIAGGLINSKTGKLDDDDGKSLDKNGWRKNE